MHEADEFIVSTALGFLAEERESGFLQPLHLGAHILHSDCNVVKPLSFLFNKLRNHSIGIC